MDLGGGHGSVLNDVPPASTPPSMVLALLGLDVWEALVLVIFFLIFQVVVVVLGRVVQAQLCRGVVETCVVCDLGEERAVLVQVCRVRHAALRLLAKKVRCPPAPSKTIQQNGLGIFRACTATKKFHEIFICIMMTSLENSVAAEVGQSSAVHTSTSLVENRELLLAGVRSEFE
eukprot:m.111577 g.111577  ORF g.111577 m.111577 type:complete len:174 (-) comp51827_c0_seq1:993-1514(-)